MVCFNYRFTLKPLQTCLIGFPPPDDAVRDFLTQDNNIGYEDAKSLVRHFLIALFSRTAETIKRFGNKKDKASRIRDFRDLMSKDQRMHSPGSVRREFYKEVVAHAQSVRNICLSTLSIFTYPLILKSKRSSEPPEDKALAKALTRLRTALNAGSNPKSMTHFIHSNKWPSRFVDVFIAFDEAHTLAEVVDDRNETRFIVLRRLLSSLTPEPLFSFFLSTTGKITQFGPPRGHDASTYINHSILATPCPFIYLGFDQLTKTSKVFERWNTLDDVTSLEYNAHLGRPL